MNTLIFTQPADDIIDFYPRFKEVYESRLLSIGKRITYDMQFNSAFGTRMLGTAITLITSSNRIVKRIIEFAEHLATHEEEFIRFNVLFMYHQSGEQSIRIFTRAMKLLDHHSHWRSMPRRTGKMVLVDRIVLMSCESAINFVDDPPKLALQRYHQEARQLRTSAAKAFHFDYEHFSNNHPHTWSFSTGDPIRGGIIMNPFEVSFRDLAYQLSPEGVIKKIPGRPPEEYGPGVPIEGTIHIYDYQDNRLNPITIPVGAFRNVIEP